MDCGGSNGGQYPLGDGSYLPILYPNASWFTEVSRSIILYVGPAYLIYLASRRILSSTMQLITSSTEALSANLKDHDYFLTGFLAHASNPLTITYYLATFGVATSGK